MYNVELKTGWRDSVVTRFQRPGDGKLRVQVHDLDWGAGESTLMYEVEAECSEADCVYTETFVAKVFEEYLTDDLATDLEALWPGKAENPFGGSPELEYLDKLKKGMDEVKKVLKKRVPLLKALMSFGGKLGGIVKKIAGGLKRGFDNAEIVVNTVNDGVGCLLEEGESGAKCELQTTVEDGKLISKFHNDSQNQVPKGEKVVAPAFHVAPTAEKLEEFEADVTTEPSVAEFQRVTSPSEEVEEVLEKAKVPEGTGTEPKPPVLKGTVPCVKEFKEGPVLALVEQTCTESADACLEACAAGCAAPQCETPVDPGEESGVANCTDGKDNDGDGPVDCYDADCGELDECSSWVTATFDGGAVEPDDVSLSGFAFSANGKDQVETDTGFSGATAWFKATMPNPGGGDLYPTLATAGVSFPLTEGTHAMECGWEPKVTGTAWHGQAGHEWSTGQACTYDGSTKGQVTVEKIGLAGAMGVFEDSYVKGSFEFEGRCYNGMAPAEPVKVEGEFRVLVTTEKP